MKHIRHILWDLDGVFFPHSERFHMELHRSLARHISQVTDLSFDEALKMATHAQATTQKCFQPFIKAYGFEFEALAEAAYGDMHIGFLEPPRDLIAAMAQTGTDHAIITRSNMAWAKRLITQLDLGHIFSERNIITCADHPGFDKAANPLAYQHTLKVMDWQADETLMVEDSQKNLKHAKALGMTTVLVYSDEEKAEYTDHVFETPAAFLAKLTQLRAH